MDETTFLIAPSGSDADSCDSPIGLSRFESFRASVRSATGSVSKSMNSIGILGSVAIAANSLTGPAMLCLPATYQRSGLIPTTVVIIFVCILSALCCLHMSNTISKIPNNQDFTSDISYSESFRHFWSPKSYNLTQVRSMRNHELERSLSKKVGMSQSCPVF
jgi:hypothetical protein